MFRITNENPIAETTVEGDTNETKELELTKSKFIALINGLINCCFFPEEEEPEDLSSNDNPPAEKVVPQQQLKTTRPQGSTSSSLMKGLNRSTGSNRMNLSSDILKVFITLFSLSL